MKTQHLIHRKLVLLQQLRRKVFIFVNGLEDILINKIGLFVKGFLSKSKKGKHRQVTCVLNNKKTCIFDCITVIEKQLVMKKIYLAIGLFYFSLFNLMAQTGPGGVGTDDGTSNLELWLKADSAYSDDVSTVANVDDQVQIWPDQSGNDNDARETGGRRPRLREITINSKANTPVLEFDGNNDRFDDVFSVAGQFNTIFTVFAHQHDGTDVDTEGPLFTLDASVETSGFFPSYANTSYVHYGGGWLSDTDPFSENVFYNSTVLFDNAFTGLYVDGDLYMSQAANSISTGDYWIGRRDRDPQNDNFFDGYMAEMIFFSRALNTAERVIIENYLASKYNMTHVTDKFAYDDAHFYDVAGIGRADASNIHSEAQSGGLVSFYNASNLDDGDYLLFGHDNAALTWSTTDSPESAVQRIAREWRMDETGDVGTVSIKLDETDIVSSVPAGYYGYILYVDSDGDFDASATAYQMTSLGGGIYEATGVEIEGGNYITIGVYEPRISFTLSSSSVSESTASLDVELTLNYTITSDITVDFAIDGGSTATGTGTDYTLNSSSPITITGGSLTNDISFTITTSDTDLELDETIIINISNPSEGQLGSTTIHTATIRDDDAGGYTGPAGVGNSSNNLIWLKPESGVYNDAGTTEASNSDAVEEWHDASGNNNDFTNSTGSEQPIFNTGGQNDWPYLDFDGTDDYLRTVSSVISGTTARTIFILTKADNTASSTMFSLSGSGGTGQLYSLTPEVALRVSGYQFASQNLGTSNYRLLSVINPENSNVGDTRFYIDGSFISNSGGTVTALNTNPASYTSIGDNTHLNAFNGQISEVIAYNEELNITRQTLVETYLAAKYNLTHASAKYAYASTHYVDVAGIGRETSSDLHTKAQSASLITLSNANGLDDGEYLVFGHDSTSIATWVTSETPESNMERINREWRFSETGGDVGNVTISFDHTNPDLAALSANFNGYLLLVDSDGDFSSGASVYRMNLSGGEYVAENINIEDGNYITIASFKPAISFTVATDNAVEGSSPYEICFDLTYTITSDVEVTYTVNGSSTATGSGTDYTLASPGTATISAGDTTTTVSISIIDDLVEEGEETIILDLSSPVNAELGDITTLTITLGDNDNQGFVGPGGVGNVNNNKLWIKADSTTLDGSNRIVTWHDLSGNGNDATQNNDGRKADYVEVTMNSLSNVPVGSFNGTSDRYEDIFDVPGQNLTIFTVFKHTPDGNLDGPIWQLDEVQTSGFFPKWQDNNNQYVADRSNGWLNKASEFNDDIWYLATVRYGTNSTELFKDGTANHSSVNNTINYGKFRLGRRSNDGAEFDGQLAELLVFSTDLSESRKNIIENYLAAKYNITISNDKYTHQATHRYDVAGIGRESSSDLHTAAQSAEIMKISNATELSDGDYLLFGHDNGDMTSYTTTESPGSSYQRFAREWRINISGDGDVGTVSITLDTTDFPALPANHYGYLVFVDADGDFSSGATPYQLSKSGDNYIANEITLADGNYISFGVYRPEIQFTATTSSGPEGASPSLVQVSVDYSISDDITVDYAVNVSSTATGTGTDYTLADGTLTLTAGNTTANISISVVDDAIVESAETIVIDISNPAIANLGTNTTHTFTLNDNDNAGFTGPAGIGNSSNNVLWLKADAGVYNDAGSTEASDGEAVQEWHDLSGNNNDLSQATAGFRPSFVAATGGTLNNKPFVQLDGTDDLMEGSNVISGNTGRSIFIVAKNNIITEDGVIFQLNNNGSSGNGLFFTVTPEMAVRVGSGNRIFNEGFSSSSFRLLSIQHADGADIDAIEMYLEGTLGTENSSASRTVNTGTGNTSIGYSDHMDEYFNGNIAEIIAYNQQLNTAQRIILENYLAAKYDLTIANPYFTYAESYGYEVAGIGQNDVASSDLHNKAQSAGFLTVSNPSDMDDGEYLLFGHDNTDFASWVSSETPTGANEERITREWRVNETGDLGTISVNIDASQLPALSIDYQGYVLLVDSDGDFSEGATAYKMTNVGGDDYQADNVEIGDGNYMTVLSFEPIIQFTNTTTAAAEGTSPTTVEVSLNYAIGSDATATYNINGGSSATGGGTDYTLVTPGTATITAGNTTTNVSITITDDSDVEGEETIIVELSSPGNSSLGDNTSNTVTISDNDNDGFVGPGGVGDANNNKLWLMGDKGTTVTGSGVSDWTDQSGNGNDATQTNDGRRAPLQYVTINSLTNVPVLAFDGTADRYENIFTVPGRDLTIFTVFKHTPDASDDGPIWQLDDVNTSGFFPKYTNGSQYVADESNGWINKTSEFNDDVWYIATVRYGTDTTELFKDGTLNDASSNNTVNIGAFRLGRRTNDGAEFDGNLAEILAYTSTLNNTQKLIVENYLASKYNITISNDYYGHQSTHRYAVAGIGQADGASADLHTAAQSDSILKISNANDLSDGEYLLFGNDSASLSWSSTEIPTTSVQRIAREWRVDETGDVGTVTITLDPAKFDAIPTNHYGYLLFVNNSVDGNFTGSTTTYQMTDIGGGLYEVEDIDLSDGSYISFGVFQPEIQFTYASSSGAEGASPSFVQVLLNFIMTTDVTADFAVNGSSSATGSGTDYTLADGTATVAAGDTSVNISISLVDDADPETDETIIIDLSNPIAGAVLGTNTQHTFTIFDNDNIGFTGPAGVGDSDNNKLWLRADALPVQGDDTDLTTWTDDSGNGNDLTQATASLKPHYQTASIGTLNNKPFVTFDGTDDYINGPNIISGNTGRTIFVVAKTASGNSGTLLQLHEDGGTGGNGTRFNITPEVGIRVASGNQLFNEGFGSSDFRIVTLNMHDGDTVGGIDMYLNGGNVTLLSSLNPYRVINTGTGNTQIGYSVHINRYFDGDIAEIIAYNNELDTAQRIIIDNYLAAKYDIEYEFDYYAYEGTHNYDIAGIGRQSSTDLHATAMSDNMVKISNAVDLDDGEYLLFGNDDGDITSWSGTEVPDAAIKRLTREWRFDKTGDPGAINITLDVTNLPALAGNDVGYLLLTDSDGDFSDGATIYSMESVGGNEYRVDSVPITDGNFVTFGVFEPIIEFASATSNAIEGSSPFKLEVSLNFATLTDVSVDFAVDGSGSATGSGTDYTLVDGSVTVTAGDTATYINIAISDDTDIEGEETIVIDISNPTNATLGTETRSTVTISDNDNIGFTGPGGVGDASVNKLWLRADSITTVADGGNVSSWSDQSGNGNDAAQGNGGRQPIFVEDQINGLSVVRFDGNSDRFENIFTVPVQNSTIFTVFKHTPDGNGDGPIWQLDNVATSGFFPEFTNGSQYLAYSNSAWLNKTSEFLDNIWYTTTVLYGQDTTALFKDGTLNHATNVNSVTIGDFRIGRRSSDGAEFDGEIAELIVYSTALNLTQRNIVDNYLSAKYNIAISNDYYAWQDNNGFELAGIGQESSTDLHTTAESGVIKVSNANDLDDGEYLLYGHNNSTIDSWTSTGSPNATTIQKLAREWRIGVTGDVGTVKITLDPTDLGSIPTNYYGYLLLVDTDGDFTDGADIYQMTESGGKYEYSNLQLYDGNYITFAVYRPSIEFTLTESNGSEGASPVSIEVSLNYTVPVDVSADYQVSLTSTATGSGIDYTLAAGTVTITSGNTTAIMAGTGFTLNDDALVEVEETVVIQLSNPLPAAAVIGNNDLHTFTINDNDNVGYTGPAGVGDANNNKLWLRADVGVYNDAGSTEASNNDNIEEWHDQSGNNNDVTQTTGSAQPTFKSSGTDINNKPYLSLDGSDVLVGPSILSGNTGRNLFIVAKMITSNGSQDGLIFSLSDAGSTGTLYSITPEAAIRISGYSVFDQGLGVSDYRLMTIDESDGAYIADVDMYLEDNVLGKSTSTTLINTGANNIKIGYSNHITQYFIGNIAEIIVFDDQMNTTQRRIVNNYLGAKYRIDLTNDYYEYDVSHGSDVAGIGQYASDDLHPKAQSAALITISNAGDLADGEYLLFGHDDGAFDTWSSSETPTASRRLAREWRIGKTGDLGTVTVAFDHTATGLPGSIPAGYEGYSLFVDSDGDFSEGATSYRMTLTGGEYVAEEVPLDDGNYFTIGVESPIVQFASATNIGIEGSSPNEIEVTLNFAIDSDVTVDYAVDGTGTTATEGVGGDFVLSAGTLTIPSGSTSVNLEVVINDDSEIEFEELIEIELTNPSNATIGTNDSTILTLSDNDDIGFEGPGGVGNSNTNKFWADGDNTGNQVDAGVVTIWADKSGNGNDATESGTRRPTLESGVLNGYSVLDFDGGNDRYTDVFTFPGRSVTIFTVFKLENTGGPLWQTSGVNTSGFFPRYTDNNQYLADQSGAWLSKSSEFNTSIWYLGTVRYSENSTQLYQDGVLNHSSSNNSINIGELQIGRRPTDGIEYNGDIAEMIVFVTNLNETQRNIIENMLAAKYNLTIAQDLFAYETYHNYEVAGIGKESDSDFHPAAQSGTIMKISNASNLDDSEYVIFGHNNADITTWSDLISVPDEYHKRIERTWRVDLTGDPGTVTVSIDQNELPSIPTNYNGYLLMVDGDGNFSSGATIYPMSLADGRYKATEVTINDGNYLAVAVYKPVIEFVASSSNGAEGASPVLMEVELNYAQKVDVTVNYSDAGGGTATGGGTDYTLNTGTVTLTAGETTGNASFSVVDDTEVEDEETVRVLISTPTNAILGDITTHTFTILDNDNDGFTGPGGVGDLESNKLWIMADQGVKNTSAADAAVTEEIATWEDQSGNANNLTQSSAGEYPTLQTQGSNNVIRFDGSNDDMTGASVLAGNKGRSIFIVGLSNSVDQGILLDLNAEASAGNGEAFRITPEIAVRVTGGNNTYATSLGTSLELLTIRHADGSLTDDIEAYVNASTIGAGTPTSQSINTDNKGIAIGESASGGASLNGDIAEIVVYEQELNETQKSIVENYLAAKYSIDISGSGTDYFAYDATYGSQVIGIGQTSTTDKHVKAQSDSMFTISNASDFDDGEFLFVGHDNGLLDAWNTKGTGAPNSATSILKRTWRITETGDVGTIKISLDTANLPAIPAGSNGYFLLVDADGDFTADATSYFMDELSGTYFVNSVAIQDGDYVTFAVAEPVIQFATTSSSGDEGGSPVLLEVQLSYAIEQTASVDYSVDGSSTATGSGTDFTLTAGTISIPAGETSANISITLNDDIDVEPEEIIVVNLDGPATNATLGTNTQHTYTITDNDNDGYVGPGGVGGSNNNILWLRADAGTSTTTPGNTIVTWTDQSGNNIAATSGNPATYREVTINSLSNVPVAEFDGNNDRYADVLTIPTNYLTLFTVFNADNDATNGPLWQTENQNVSGFLPNLNGTQYVADQNAAWLTQATDFAFTTWHIGAVRYMTDSTEVIANGTLSDASSNNSIAVGDFQIGRRPSDGLEYNGYIAEMFVYKNALNDVQMTIVHNYLAAKYDIVVANDKYAHDGTHRYDVAGIGRESATNIHTAAQSADMIKVSNASDLDDGEYLHFGHDNGTIVWEVSADIPTAGGLQRIAREWKFDHDGGDIGNVILELDITNLDALPAGHSGYFILADTDGNGDFTDGSPTINKLTRVEGSSVLYQSEIISVPDNAVITVATAENLTNGDGDWSDPGTWLTGVVPTSTESVTISAGDSIWLTEDISIASLTVTGALNINDFRLILTTGTIANTGNFYSGTNGTVRYGATGAQDVADLSYQNLEISGSGTKTLQNSLDLPGNLRLIGGELDVSTFDINIEGDYFNVGGTLNEQTRTVTFDGSGSPQSISGEETFYNVVVNNASGLNLQNNTTISNQITLTSGKVTLGTADLILQASASTAGVDSTTRYFVATSSGFLRKEYSANGQYKFEIGDDTRMMPVYINLTDNSGLSSAYIRANMTLAQQPNIDGGFVTNYLTGRYYTIEGSGITSPFHYNASFYYLETDYTGDESLMVMAKYSGGDWTYGGTVNTTTNFLSATGIPGFSDFTGTDQGADPLPVELLNFDASIIDGEIALLWTTAYEYNSDKFIIQRSSDGFEFEDIGEKKSIGFSNSINHYTFNDTEPIDGIAYYRLVQMDYDGKMDVSKVISIVFTKVIGTDMEVMIYPNPVLDNRFNLVLEGVNVNEEFEVVIYDLMGNIVYKSEYVATSNGDFRTEIEPLSSMKDGIYVVNAYNSQRVLFRKRIIVK